MRNRNKRIPVFLLSGALIAGLSGLVATVPASAASPTGHKLITASLSASNKIRVQWGATTGVKYYKVRAASNPAFTEDLTTWKVPKSSTTKWINANSSKFDFAKPSSGNYVFVRVYAIKKNGKTGVSPYKRIKLNPPAAPAGAQQLNVATFNVRTATEEVKGHSWGSRVGEVASRIRESGADVVAVQEAGENGSHYDTVVYTGSDGQKHKKRDYYWQFEELRDKVGAPYQLVDTEEYSTGVGKEGTRILYNADKFSVLDKGVFAPSAVTKYLRYVPWALLQNKTTGKQVYVISAHLDPRKDKAGSNALYNLRIKQVKTIIDKARTFKARGIPVVLAGDLNSNIYSSPNNGVDYKLLYAGFYDAYATRNVVNPYRVTYNGFVRSKQSASRTDYIFTFGAPQGSYKYTNWIGKVGGEWPSDHNMQSAVVPY
jgi:endonuclease/exonuclease/phosphatase family metal-dependent hydrolase